jgi:hypothetical protein
MRLIRTCAFALLMGASLSSMRLDAQASGFGVKVRPTVVAAGGDTVTMSYIVTVAASARDSLALFLVDAPGVMRVDMPGQKPEWMVRTRWRARPVAEWGKLSRLVLPGDSTPALSFTARGLLDVVQYWAQIDPRADSLIVDVPPDSSLANDSLVTVTGSTGFTLGVTALPSDMSTGALAARLSSLIARACALGWIDNNGICNSLQVKAKAESGPLNALMHELNAQRGNHVSEAAYTLISQNTSFLLARL